MNTANEVDCSHSMSAVSDCKVPSLGMSLWSCGPGRCRRLRTLPRQPEFYSSLTSLSAAPGRMRLRRGHPDGPNFFICDARTIGRQAVAQVAYSRDTKSRTAAGGIIPFSVAAFAMEARSDEPI